MTSKPPILTVVVPCYNEQKVLPETAKRLSVLRDELVRDGLAAVESLIVFVDDGSSDGTWPIIDDLAGASPHFGGVKLSCNRGHQNALLSGLLSAPGDVLVSVDADLQDDLAVIPEMLRAHRAGADVVYGVRRSRGTDTLFKRLTAETYYHFLGLLGANVVFNHADYRLMSRRAVEALRQFEEVNLFLRGIIPQLGFKSHIVAYDRKERFAGESKYPLGKMFALALEGVTSLSVRPLRWITMTGIVLSMVSFLIAIWAAWARLFGNSYVPGWASTVVPMYFLGGIQLLSLGIVGEYLGKVYLETKRRPRFIIETVVGFEPKDSPGG